jgi:hypothetical protein
LPIDLTEGIFTHTDSESQACSKNHAAIAIVLTRELGFPEEIVNVEGAAVAHGHPAGATGAVLTSSFTRCGATGSSVALSRFHRRRPRHRACDRSRALRRHQIEVASDSDIDMSPNKDSGTAVVVGVGAERGLGAALCRRFGAEGYHVLVAGRTPEKLAQVVKTIGAAGGSAEAITVDTTREDDVSFASLIGRSRPAMAARRPMWSSSTPATTGASISRS